MKPATYDAPGQTVRNSLTPLPAMRESAQPSDRDAHDQRRSAYVIQLLLSARHNRPHNLGQ
jgi:hypothetical protein